ncbi:MAG: hypothetical protein ACQEQF_00695 [Bacillota bacterium]
MVYVIYDNESKVVKQINTEEPTTVEEGFSVATSDALSVGDEITYHTIIHEVDEDGKITRYSGYTIAPNVKDLLDKLDKKETEVENLKSQLTLTQQALDELILGGAL